MILALIGRSGSGKSALAQMMKKRYGYEIVRTCTTRARRDGEALDAYHFMSSEEFQKRLADGEFVEWDKYGDNRYGMLKASLEEGDRLVAVLTPEGAEAAKKAFPETFIVHVYADSKISMQRAIGREQELDPAKIDRISKRAMLDYYLYQDPVCDMVVPNCYGAQLDHLAYKIKEAHERYTVRGMVKDVTDTLKECREELEAYDKKKAEGQDV